MATENAREHWLKCLVDKGMFSHEFAVSYPPEVEVTDSVFVPASAVRGSAGETGKVRVKLIKPGDKTLVLLPSEDQRIVTVEERDVTETP